MIREKRFYRAFFALTLFLALPLIRRVKRQIGAAQEAQKRTAGQMINSEV